MAIVVIGSVFVDIKGFPEDLYIPTGRNAGRVETVYIIPDGEGCLVAAAHCTFESAAGFGVHFANMLNTLTLLQG